MSRVEVVGAVLDGRSPHLRLKVDGQEIEIPLLSIWRALAKASITYVDPFAVTEAVRVAILDTDGRPVFATLKPQIRGTLFIRTETRGDSFLPQELVQRVVSPGHLPALVGRWVLSVRDQMSMTLPKIQDLGGE